MKSLASIQILSLFVVLISAIDASSQKFSNEFLNLGIGADGLKTGHTNEAGYGLVGSAKQGDRRVIFMISGLDSKQDRADEAEKITNWAFRQFTMKKLFDKDTEIARADVWLGADESVPLVAKDDIATMVAFGKQDSITATISYDGPLQAPVAQGDAVAELTITSPDLEPVKFPLYAGQDVEAGGIVTRIRASASILSSQVLGYIRPSEG